MSTLGTSRFGWLEFDAEGRVVDPSDPAALNALLDAPGTTDLVVMSHGWKNDRRDASELYGTLWKHASAALGGGRAEHMVVLGVLWPAKAYETDFDAAALALSTGGGTLSHSSRTPPRDLDDEELEARLAAFRAFVGPDGDAVVAAARSASRGITGRTSRPLVEAARKLVASAAPGDVELAVDARPFTSLDDAQPTVAGLAAPPVRKVEGSVGGAKGLDDVVGSVFQGTRAAVARFLNQLTYFEMKKRAGTVGAALGSTVLPALRPSGQAPVRLHLVGHSFGARLVTAAASALPADARLDFFSLTLLQGAFSHNALAKEVGPGLAGAFPNVVGRPSGPIAMTHTHNDLACTLAYALASRLSWDKATKIGDKDDVFGAMGANGAQGLAASALAPDHRSGPFAPVKGKVNRFLADAYVVKTAETDAHNNVTNAQVGKLLAAVLAA